MTTTIAGSASQGGESVPAGPADSPFVRACRRLPVPHTPVWFMRQAGRSLPEYRELRAGVPMLESCRRPELVREITLQPVRRHGVDAAILFSDIVVPVAAAGVDLEIVPGTGPVVAEPVRDAADVDRIRPITADDLSFVDEAVRLLVADLGDTPLIGFAGAPFTLASYLVEGGPSRTHAKTKALMYGAPEVWHALCGRLAEITAEFLRVQVNAGVAAVQLFDSWAGALSEADYRRLRAAALGQRAGRARRRRGARGSTSGWAPPSCSARWARPVRTWSGSTGVPRWTPRPCGSARTRRSRATWTRACSSPRGR